MAETLRIGTRASKLARWQAEWVTARLTDAGYEVELIEITTEGDAVQQRSIASLGMVGAFTKEIQQALLDDRIDVAVHSLKDLPTDVINGLMLSAVPARERCGDAFICETAATLDDLPTGARVGTGSMRRKSQLLHMRSDLKIEGIRGNVDTRLRKLTEGEFDAIVLAEAGLVRLGLDGHIRSVFDKSRMLPAVGQGALGLEARTDDTKARAALATLNDDATHAAVLAERAMLLALAGGCLAPVGAWARTGDDGQLLLEAAVLSGDGKERVAAEGTAPVADAVALGQRVADDLLAQGADRLIAACRAE